MEFRTISHMNQISKSTHKYIFCYLYSTKTICMMGHLFSKGQSSFFSFILDHEGPLTV